MPHPLLRAPASPEETEDPQSDFFSDDRNFDWQDGDPDFSLAYDEAEEPAVDTDSDDLEATMMSNLEAVASAFWMESGPELAPLDESGDDTRTHSRSVAAPPLDPENESWDFREPSNDEFIGPRRGALLDFRPPSARHERPVRKSRTGGRVVKERAQQHGGAFADDLAARNKEFYELLKAPSQAPRKIAAAPAVRPGSRSFFAGDADAGRAPFVPQSAPATTGFSRRGLALAIVVLAVGAGAAVFAARSGGGVAPASAVAATAPQEETTSFPAARDDGIRAPSEAIPKVVKTERVSVADSDASAPIAPAPVPVAPPVDPGTLATPPLYESDSAATAKPSGPDSRANPLASLDLRPANSPSLADVQTKTTETAPVTGSIADDPVVLDEAPPATAKAKSEPAAKPDKPASKKVASVAPNGMKARAASGTAKVTVAVNMRSGPDNDSRVVKVVAAGARVDIVSCKMWCEVVAGGDRGYIFQRFLDRTPGPRASASTPKAEVVKASDEAGDHRPLDLLRLVRPTD